jgi:small subunit ribosomal protein S21
LKGSTFVIGVTVQNNENIDRALRRFKKKYERSGVLREFKKRTAFMKPSIEKRMQRLKAARRQHKQSMEQD